MTLTERRELMNPATVIAIVALVIIVSLAIRYIVREKKRGVKCVGCPFADSCEKYGGPKNQAHHCK